MAFNSIKNLLKENLGLHVDSVGVSSIERAISHRMSHVGMSSEDSYYSLLESDEKEFEELVEEVVVPETWFFRNKSPFEALRECVLNMGVSSDSSSGREPLRILSMPCATGEEPYSIAMTLRDAGLSGCDFSIDGIDVSKRALTKARRAIYGKHSFREDNLNIQNKFFKKTRSGFQIIPEIQERVSFEKANIITDNICPSNDYYDIIFCRNLLIYFSRETQNLVLEKVRLMLKPGGYLFVGHAETAQVNKKYFMKIDIPKSFAYQKISNKISASKKSEHIGSVDKLKNIYNQLVEVAKKDVQIANKIKQSKTISSKRSSSMVGNGCSWGRVEGLIDGGHFDEATSLCESMLAGDPENADGYYYLGLISSLCGSKGGAESLLKKAIYLSPNHQKALGLSVLLAEGRGDDEGADYYRRRELKARERNNQ
jgi:chemotaxis protein methyltransferase WspC